MEEIASLHPSTGHGASMPSRAPEHLGRPWEISAAREHGCNSPKKNIASGHVALVRQLFERPRLTAQTQHKSGIRVTVGHDNGTDCNPKDKCCELHALGSPQNEVVQLSDLKLSSRKQTEMRLDTDAEQVADEGEEQSEDE